jgi:predicted flap endonuclease-1-like 5' DNA nuclease
MPPMTALLPEPAAVAPRPEALDRQAASPRGLAPAANAMSLHVSKLRGISVIVRRKLKRHGITYTHQLLQLAGPGKQRHELARQADIDEAALTRLVQRADLARVKGIGAIFADMLELVGVNDVAGLAQQVPGELHRALYQLNAAERLARRAPTADEVDDWVHQAQGLPLLVDG